MSRIEAIIANYYPAIDRVDIDAVLALFAPDAIYQRADVRYEGRPAIDHFFRVERRIRGEHVIEQRWADPDRRTVFVIGRFEGVGEQGDARSVGFADLWQFNTANLVELRRTFLSIGHAYVRD